MYKVIQQRGFPALVLAVSYKLRDPTDNVYSDSDEVYFAQEARGRGCVGVEAVAEGGGEEDEGSKGVAREIGREEEVGCAVCEAGDGAEVEGEVGF